jgi:energy-coupling factor transporter ATP-binding protein EcfA2
MIGPGDILVVTGIMAAGKSTIAQALAELWSPSVHLRGDVFRRMIVNGQEPVTLENWPAAERQLHLRYDLATTAALRYAVAGFIVCYQDVIIGTELSRNVPAICMWLCWHQPRPSPWRAISLVTKLPMETGRRMTSLPPCKRRLRGSACGWTRRSFQSIKRYKQSWPVFTKPGLPGQMGAD